MMKFVFSMLMLMPLSFLGFYWMVQYMIFVLGCFFMFNCLFVNYLISISGLLGCDSVSYLLIILSFWICSLMILASSKIYSMNDYYKEFIMLLLILLLSLFLTFTSMNLFYFYFFFEISLIPTLMLIMGWGYQPERLEAGIYLLFYTLLMSLPMMLGIFYYNYINDTLIFLLMKELMNSIFFYLCINMVFFVKIPMFIMHLWLPKAHVEAPVSGSMILAGVMLKLGGYGLLRLMILFKGFINSMNLFFISLSLMGAIFVSLICIRQSDMKSLIAYSSVAHMGLVMIGIMTLNIWGIKGSVIMMIAHGLCSSGLFCLVNFIYERTLSRSIYLNKGMLNLLPSMSLWWFLLLSSNMAAPPSLNLISEIMLINSILSFSILNMLFLGVLSFLSAVYSLFLYSYSQHGKFFIGMNSFSFNVNREYLLMFLHWIPLNLLFMKLDIFM
uniref:NADH-ubiquinone oxidoreductase chain 4 n=1 Tax=Batophila aerata TaxID=877817 RepID=A0A3G1GRL1_9CUCU|nr:NADH dehydrogenase subunit 4 [Batophila aerata]